MRCSQNQKCLKILFGRWHSLHLTLKGQLESHLLVFRPISLLIHLITHVGYQTEFLAPGSALAITGFLGMKSSWKISISTLPHSSFPLKLKTDRKCIRNQRVIYEKNNFFQGLKQLMLFVLQALIIKRALPVFYMVGGKNK